VVELSGTSALELTPEVLGALHSLLQQRQQQPSTSRAATVADFIETEAKEVGKKKLECEDCGQRCANTQSLSKHRRNYCKAKKAEEGEIIGEEDDESGGDEDPSQEAVEQQSTLVKVLGPRQQVDFIAEKRKIEQSSRRRGHSPSPPMKRDRREPSPPPATRSRSRCRSVAPAEVPLRRVDSSPIRRRSPQPEEMEYSSPLRDVNRRHAPSAVEIGARMADFLGDLLHQATRPERLVRQGDSLVEELLHFLRPLRAGRRVTWGQTGNR
jgi:hypothetical protein